MIHEKDKQEGQRQTMHAEREQLQQATRRFIRGLLRSGVNVALLPVTRLPREPRQHFLAAGGEFTRGWAFGIEGLAKATGTPTHDGAGAHATGAAGDSQET